MPGQIAKMIKMAAKIKEQGGIAPESTFKRLKEQSQAKDRQAAIDARKKRDAEKKKQASKAPKGFGEIGSA